MKSSRRPTTSIPLSRPWFPPKAGKYLNAAIADRRLGSGGRFGAWCERHIEKTTRCRRAIMTNSGSSALEAACLLAGVSRGDEVVVPSFAFPTAASAILKCGATPVLVDIEAEHLTIDCDAVERAASPRTKAVIAVDYGGMPCAYDRLSDLAERHGFAIIEDAAHAYGARFRGKALGTFGVLGAYSFQQTKNVSCGEGGALLVNDPALVAQAEELCDKGTNRRDMLRGLVPSYEWVGIGGGIGLNELSAAVLRSQFEQAGTIKRDRRRIFDRYLERLARLDESGSITLIKPVDGCDHNAHLVAFLAPDHTGRDRILQHLNDRGIGAAFHYAPLHTSKAGRAFGRRMGGCPVTDDVAGRIVRLPIHYGLSDDEIDKICAAVAEATQPKSKQGSLYRRSRRTNR